MTITVTYDPEKWKLVPVEPGTEIIEAIAKASTSAEWPGDFGYEAQKRRRAYALIAYLDALSAAPTPPTGKTEAEIKAEALIEIASHVREVRDDCIKHDIARMIEGFSELNQLANQYRENKEK